MTTQRSLLPRGVVALCLAVAVVLTAGPLASGAPTNVRVHPATPITQVSTESNPVWALVANGTVYRALAVWSGVRTDSPDSSVIKVARSSNGGTTWESIGPIPQGLENFLGDPQIAWDPVANRFYFVMESCFPPAHKCPPNVVFSDDFGTTFSAPNDIWKQIQDDNIEIATNPDIAVDVTASSPHGGRVYVTWTNFNIQTPGSTFVIQSSDDGSTTWTPPITVSDPKFGYAENGRVEVASNGDVYAEYMGYDATARQYRVVVTRSTDGGATWGPGVVAMNSIQSTGVLKTCGNRGNIAVLNGDLDSFPIPSFAVDPTDPNRLYLAYHAPGPGSNLPDVYVIRSSDGGKTWSAPAGVGTGPRDQWAPSIEVGPKGEVGVSYYSRQNDSANLKMDVYARFSSNHGASWGPPARVSKVSFLPPKLLPNADLTRRPCDSPFRNDIAYPGSGAYVIWVDTRDTGPAANNGVDANIYVAHQPVPTTISAAVTKTTRAVNVAGAVSPSQPGGKVTATLYRKVSGVFKKVTAKTATLNAASKYTLSFTRTAAGSCQVIATYPGNFEYLNSSVTKAFTC